MFVRSSVLMPNLLGVNQAVPRTSNLPDAGFLTYDRLNTVESLKMKLLLNYEMFSVLLFCLGM